MAEEIKKAKKIKVNGVFADVDLSTVGHLTSPNGLIEYTLKVDNEGNLYAVDEKSIPGPLTPPSTTGSTLAKLYINSFYCGGKDANEHTLNYCSHNFVELSNLTNNDINLKGLSLQYSINGIEWKVLPLSGVIKKGSTFVIRGAQCSMLNSPTTRIKVDKYDLEWRLDTGELIKFDSETSAKFYLAFTLNAYPGEQPYDTTTKNAKTDAIGYIDLIGVKGTGSSGGFETTEYNAGGGLSNTKLFRKYYAMDPVKQATKGIGKRNNSNDWCYVDLTKKDGELIPCVEVYRPMASEEHKNIFYNKTKLFDNKPSIITCSFGRQATDNGNGATRCFNWLTKNPDNKYIWIRPTGASSWGIANESFHAADGRTAYNTPAERTVYDRIMKEYTNDTVIIVNKFIKSGFTAGTYEYVAGSMNADGAPNLDECTPVYTFTVRTDTAVNAGFKFVQTSDQQGFNWEEYRLWEASSKLISEEPRSNDAHFMINTGDMTQNGNRVNEWKDYFDAKGDFFNNMEEMATIGNNDLSLNVLYEMGNGEDNNKLWHENYTFFYTAEIDTNNPPIFTGYDGNDYYIPSLYSFNYGKAHFLCMNTEIKKATETDAYGYNFGKEKWGNFYPQIWQWCENDIEPYSGDSTIWKIVFCHEMPFTILTPKVTETAGGMLKVRTGGSNANENIKVPAEKGTGDFWLSEFCQTHNVKLCIGGHKHTEASTWQILENVAYDGEVRSVDSMHPIIVVSKDTSSPFYIGNYRVLGHEGDAGTTALTPYEGYQYPNTWFKNDGTLKDDYLSAVQMCTFAFEDDIPAGSVPVLYAMSQATAYKHTSNKELPGLNIPWLRYYFPRATYDTAKDEATAAAAQKFPFYTIWTITPSTITGEVRKTYGGFNDKGKFDINIDWPYVKEGWSAVEKNKIATIHSINGITNMDNTQAETDTRIISISK